MSLDSINARHAVRIQAGINGRSGDMSLQKKRGQGIF